MVIKSTAEPSRLLHRGTAVKSPWSTWNSRCVPAELSWASGRTLFSPGARQQEVHSAGALQSEPSASPPRCSISSPTCGVYTWGEGKTPQFNNTSVSSVTGSDTEGCFYMEAGLKLSPEELLLHAVLKSEVAVQSHVKFGLFFWWRSSAAARWGLEDVSVDISVPALHLCCWSCTIAASQPIRRPGAQDNGVNLMPVRQNRWDASSVCHRSGRSVGKWFSWGGHGNVSPSVTQRSDSYAGRMTWQHFPS